MTIAQRFSVGLGREEVQVPEGRLNWGRNGFISAVPSGLNSRAIPFPTLKRWAIVMKFLRDSPFGIGHCSFIGHWPLAIGH